LYNSSSSKNNGYIFEQQNDVRLNELGSKISAIKNVSNMQAEEKKRRYNKL
jgi:hypothetical protein